MMRFPTRAARLTLLGMAALVLAVLAPPAVGADRLREAGRGVVDAASAVGGVQTPTERSFPRLSEAKVREWLTFLASDVLQGREVFTEGYGIAAAYVAEQLRQLGVKPLGDAGSYLQSVKLNGYRVTRNSAIAIDVGGQSRAFRHGEHVTFPLASGGNQTLAFTGVEIRTTAPAAPAPAAAGGRPDTSLKGKLVVYLAGRRGDARGDAEGAAAFITERGAAGVLTFVPAAPPAPDQPPASAGTAGSGRGGRGRGGAAGADLTTVERVDRLVPPALTVDETLLAFLFSASPEPFDAIRAKVETGEPLPAASLPNVSVTITIDNRFEVVSTQLTANVVGMVEGADPRLRDTYVVFGAHLDHVGYARGTEPKGVANVPIADDRIWNGADDDGSGSAGLLAIAKAFAEGPKPRRSVMFVWHAGEESGLLGSRYMADFPVVPLDRIQAQLNVDMIGRNRDDRASEENTLYVIGADRISTDLHNIVVDTNQTLARPLTLDFEFNDPADVHTFYTRSDHYSYASRGIPIAFFFTGTHADYHANSDSVDKILFPKLIRVAEFIYRTGFNLADSERPLERDHLGARTGKGPAGRLEKPARP